MPVILESEQFEVWLTALAKQAIPMLKPWVGDLTIVPVNRAMSSWRNDKPEDAAQIGEPIPNDVPQMFHSVRASQ